MIIDNLTLNAAIKIYTINGELVRALDYSTQNGRAVWDGKNDSGKEVAGGVYILYVESPSGTRKIKIAVVK
jgi:flagellar hook assembly protein FlgD